MKKPKANFQKTKEDLKIKGGKEERLKRQGITLAVPADERKVKNFGNNFYIQPKLNGERGVVDNFEGHPIILSSYQNSFEFLDNIRAHVAEAWETFGIPLPFDGEIYKHGWSRERIDSALRRTVNYNPEIEQLEFHIFDLKLPILQSHRLYLLDRIFEKIPSTGPLKKVPTFRGTPYNWMEYSEKFLELGYEGSILRNPVYPEYYSGRTVKQMLKYKPTEIDEYVIIGVEEAISKDGEYKGMVGAFIVRAHDGVDTFKVGAGKLDHDTRRAYWLIQASLIGRVLITKQGKILTSNGIPTCAVAVEIKDEN